MRRTGVVAVPLLGLLVACGGGQADGRAGPRPSPEPTAPAAAAAEAAVGREELEAAAFEAGTRVGGFAVSAFALDGPSYDELEYRADRAVCQPLVSLAPGATETDPGATVNRRVELGDGVMAPKVDVQLRSYPEGGAEAVLAALRTAGTACGDGFTEDRTLARAPVLAVTGAAAPDAGDESVAFRLEVRDVKDPDTVFTEYLTVVRVGTVTAAFRLEPLDEEDHGRVPDVVVAEQLGRLTG
ncbi:hypothetical protein V1J52_07275 [Streptomyces sp. TRM 70351]|uniref:hypothetical protein n=1 Tax=Streptomyces sp. TRM 70351 TaxID=3116552 RepID=UPI002E7BA969|nr:hypothetical protein [Streptomyces sp. TRM 70351]MEE1927997.1 hypothetical protein [Streptomyces sp. TRM 70351]